MRARSCWLGLFLFVAPALPACGQSSTSDGADTANLAGPAASIDQNGSYTFRVARIHFAASAMNGGDWDFAGGAPDPFVCFSDYSCTDPCADTYDCVPPADGRLYQIIDDGVADERIYEGFELINGIAVRAWDYDDIISNDLAGELFVQFSVTGNAHLVLWQSPDGTQQTSVDYTLFAQ
jgi:hypothetical protein